MRQITTAILASLLLFFSQSCTKECKLGYEGKDCKTEVRAKYYGTYKGAYLVGNNSFTGYWEVGTTSSDVEKILIGSLTATFENNSGDFYFATQPTTSGGTVFGRGQFENKKLIINFHQIDFNGQEMESFFVGLKQD